MAEPRSLPELVAARASGGLAGEEFVPGVSFAHLADVETTPEWLWFLHEQGPWQVPGRLGVAVLEPLTLLIAARAVARALGLHEQDRVAASGDLGSLRLQIAGAAAALYAGSAIVPEDDGPTVIVTESDVVVAGERRAFVGWPETCGVAGFTVERRIEPLERVELEVVDDELLVRGPVVMAGYTDREATAAAFSGGWFHTGQYRTVGAGSAIVVQ